MLAFTLMLRTFGIDINVKYQVTASFKNENLQMLGLG